MPIERVEVLDYVAFGRIIVDWALDPAKRPQDLAGVKAALRDVVVIPDRIQTVSYVEVAQSDLVIRLPNPDMVQESLNAFQAGQRNDAYPVPLFYRNLLSAGSNMSKLDALYSRIADYTIAQCR